MRLGLVGRAGEKHLGLPEPGDVLSASGSQALGSGSGGRPRKSLRRELQTTCPEKRAGTNPGQKRAASCCGVYEDGSSSLDTVIPGKLRRLVRLRDNGLPQTRSKQQPMAHLGKSSRAPSHFCDTTGKPKADSTTTRALARFFPKLGEPFNWSGFYLGVCL